MLYNPRSRLPFSTDSSVFYNCWWDLIFGLWLSTNLGTLIMAMLLLLLSVSIYVANSTDQPTHAPTDQGTSVFRDVIRVDSDLFEINYGSFHKTSPSCPSYGSLWTFDPISDVVIAKISDVPITAFQHCIHHETRSDSHFAHLRPVTFL